METTSLYIHVPFCVKKCAYCDFLSFASDDQTIEQYVVALIDEIIVQGSRNKFKIRTVFIGGGTPTVLNAEQLNRITDAIEDGFDFVDDYEFTIEMNPKTLNTDMLDWLKNSPVNRISIGLQSTHNHLLKTLSRIHSYEEFYDCYKALRNIGVTNINIDLMSGLPNQTEEEWEETLRTIIDLSPEHISAYSLIVEESTPFYELYEEDALNLPGEVQDREMYHRTKALLAEAGYERYEISNYSKPGKECRHNVVYWTNGSYIGIGLGSASYVEGDRFKNTSDMKLYLAGSKDIDSIRVLEQKHEVKYEMEEAMFLGLRLIEGVSYSELIERFGNLFIETYEVVIKEHIDNGLLELEGDRLQLTDRGIDLSNQVFSSFILTD